MKKENKLNKNKLYIFIGPPGCGKGSISQLCLDKFNWTQLSTGNLCRQHIKLKTEIGKKIDADIKEGRLISDQVIISMVDQWLSEQINQKSDRDISIILDGYPRTLIQAKALFDLLSQDKFSGFKIELLKMAIKDEQVIARLSARRICKDSNCQSVYSLIKNSPLNPHLNLKCDNCNSDLIQRSDDNPSAIEARLKMYYEHEKELLAFYKNNNYQIKSLNVDQPIDKVFNEFLSLVNYNSNNL